MAGSRDVSHAPINEDMSLSNRDSNSESSIDITDDCLHDIQDRLNQAEITADDDLRVRVYLQPGVPNSYSADELISLIASMRDASRAVVLYLHHFDKNTPPAYAAFLDGYKNKNALIEKKAFRKSEGWQHYRNSVESFTHLNRADKEILADILLISQLDLAQQSTSNAVRNVILMDRSVSDDIRAILEQGVNGFKPVILGKYEDVLELPHAFQEQNTSDASLDDFIDPSWLQATVRGIHASDPQQALLFTRRLADLAEKANASRFILTTPPHVHHSFVETHPTPELRPKAVSASATSPRDVSASSGGAFGIFGNTTARSASATVQTGPGLARDSRTPSQNPNPGSSF